METNGKDSLQAGARDRAFDPNRDEWVTRPYVVTLSDGSRHSTYAASLEEAEERYARFLRRHGDERRHKRGSIPGKVGKQ